MAAEGAVAISLSTLVQPLPITSALFPSTLPVQEENLVATMDLDLFSKKELLHLFKEISRSNQLISTETQLFERFLSRIQPHRTPSATKGAATGGKEATDEDGKNQRSENDAQQATASSTAAQQPQAGGGANNANRRDKKKKNEKTKEVEKIAVLTVDQKADIAIKEQEELRDEIDRIRKDWEKDADNLKVIHRDMCQL